MKTAKYHSELLQDINYFFQQRVIDHFHATYKVSSLEELALFVRIYLDFEKIIVRNLSCYLFNYSWYYSSVNCVLPWKYSLLTKGGVFKWNPGFRLRFPAAAGNFSLYHRVQNGAGAHPASYPMGTWV
jgi:hypothetical protein